MAKKPAISVCPVTAFLGYPRSGKTYHMTLIAQRLIAAGEPVAANYEMKGSLPITSDLEMVHLAGYHVFLDEWHIQRDQKDWRKLPKLIKHLTSQASKHDLHIYWSAQDWFFMPSSIRMVTEYAWVHESIFRNPHTDRSRIGLHRAVRVAGAEVEAEHRNPRVMEKRYFRIGKKIGSCYNSRRAVFVPEEVISEQALQLILNPTERQPVAEVDMSRGQSFRDVYFVEREKRVNDSREKDPKST